VSTVSVLARLLIILLLPISMSVSSGTLCITPACCGPNCARGAPVNQLSCCQSSTLPDKATNQARDTQSFESIGGLPAVAMIIAIPHIGPTTTVHVYSPPHLLVSLALLCSRQI
jgi:hypothetical protein